MSDPSQEAVEQATDVDEILADYLQRIDNGESIDRNAFVAEHPRAAAALQAYFDGADEVDRIAGPIIDATKATASIDNDTATTENSPATAQEASIPEEFGRYRIIRTLGQGAMGSVYLAEDTQLDRQVALKVPRFAKEEREELQLRFHREAKAAATLSHPNVCPVFDVGEIDGTHFISMGYVDGRPLSDFINPKTPQPQGQVAAIIRKLALALDEAHQLGIVHRDIKPANIMIDQRREPILMDFGLARSITGPDDVQVTKDGAIIGTPAYMAPEQVKGKSDQVGPAADIYSLGVVMYEMLTGQLPFAGSLTEVIARVLHDPTPQPSAVRTNVDPQLDAICVKMMSKAVADRFASMAELATELSRYLQHPENSAPPTTPEPTSSQTTTEESSPAQRPEKKYVKWASQQLPKAKRGTQEIRESNPLKVASFVVIPLVLFAAVGYATVVYVRSNSQTIKIEIDDPSAKVIIDDETVEITGVGDTVKLKPGQHNLVVERGDIVVKTRKFEVTKGKNPVLRISILKPEPTPKPPNSGVASLANTLPITIVAKEARGYEVGSVKADTELQIQYVSGKWKGWGTRADISPDNTAGRGGESCLLAIVDYPQGDATTGKVLKLVPEGTAQTPFTYVLPQDAENLILRINDRDDDWSRNPGSVQYKVLVGNRSLGGTTKNSPAAEGGLGAAAPAAADESATGATSAASAERRAANWVISVGGDVTIHTNGTPAGKITKTADLPRTPFQVTAISLEKAKIDDEDLKNLEGLTNLQSLRLVGTPVTGVGLKYLADQASITTVGIEYSGFTDAGMAELAKLKGLKILGATHTAISDSGIAHLIGHPELSIIGLYDSRVTNGCLTTLKTLPMLTILNLDGRPITDAGMVHFGEMPNLEVLRLGAAPISDVGIMNLKSLPKLNYLNPGGPKVTEAGLEKLQAARIAAGLQKIKTISRQ